MQIAGLDWRTAPGVGEACVLLGAAGRLLLAGLATRSFLSAFSEREAFLFATRHCIPGAFEKCCALGKFLLETSETSLLHAAPCPCLTSSLVRRPSSPPHTRKCLDVPSCCCSRLPYPRHWLQVLTRSLSRRLSRSLGRGVHRRLRHRRSPRRLRRPQCLRESARA